MMSDEQNRTRILMESVPGGWDRAPISLAYEIRAFLQSVKDVDSSIDSGTDGASGDLWVTVQGVEYFINIRKSNSQIAKEMLENKG